MSAVTIVKKSTLEELVSQRDVWYDIYVNGTEVASVTDICEALDIKEELEAELAK